MLSNRSKMRIFATMMALVTTIIVSLPNTSFAAPNEYTLLEPLPCIGGEGSTCKQGEVIKTVNFQNYVQLMFNIFIAVAAVAAVFMIVWGGFEYASSTAFTGKESGREKMSNAIKGLLLVLASFLILKTINPKFVDIPQNLVEPLKLKIDKILPTALDNYEKQLWEEHKEVVANTLASNTDLRTANEERLEWLEDINKKLTNPNLTAEEKRDLLQAKAQYESEIIANKQKISFDTAMALIQTVSATCLSTPSVSCADEQAKIANYYVKYSGQVSPEQHAELQRQALYQQANASINKAIGLVTDAQSASGWGRLTNALPSQKEASIKMIWDTVDKYQSLQSTNPQLLTQLRARAQESVAQIREARYK